MENLSDVSQDSAPEEITFTQAKKTKLKLSTLKQKKTKKIPKIINKYAPQLKLDIEEKLPLKSLKKIDERLNLMETDSKNSPKKIIDPEAYVRKTKVINKKIKLVFQNNKRPMNKLNKEALAQRQKYFFEEKTRVPLQEIIQK